MAVSASDVKHLRELTGVGMMEAKKALEEAGGDPGRAQDILRQRGLVKAGKRADRETRQGIIESYIHGEGRIGVLVEVNCETDFVARNEDFKTLVHDLALHIAAANPLYVSREDVPAQLIDKEKEIYKEQAVGTVKSPEILEKIVSGKLEKFYGQVCLMEQPYVKDEDMSVNDLVASKIATIGENIQVRRFSRYVLGE